MVAAILYGRALFRLLGLLAHFLDPVTAYIYNRQIHDTLRAQPGPIFTVIQGQELVTGLLMIWCAALVHTWINQVQLSGAKLDE